uniref:Spermatogenesis-associated protein 6 N-terminal domain-containing protein n=1 Tax=Amphiprion percula TaxID=161767 RepID=A0A3P8T9X3_AMPPE
SKQWKLIQCFLIMLPKGSMYNVSCPGVHLAAKDDVYLSMCFMGQCRQSESLPALFPLLLHEKMTFEKIFRHAVDPGDIAVMLECK